MSWVWFHHLCMSMLWILRDLQVELTRVQRLLNLKQAKRHLNLGGVLKATEFENMTKKVEVVLTSIF